MYQSFRRGPMNFHETVRTLREVASAIAYLHGHTNGAIAHGDIQPANIFILPGGNVKLANFTCAFQYILGQPTSTRHLPETITVPEQPSLYSSPESRSHFQFPTLAGDVWRLGAVILSSFSARFRRTDINHYILHLGRGNSPLDLKGVLADCDTRVHEILGTTLMLDPSNRPSASTVLSGLSRLL
ncbi:hypothetical protein RSAG8_09816, partial [Rhizoctonia solani AG-8 WAC10335]